MLAFKQVRLSPQQKVKKRLSRVVCFSFSSLDLKFPRSLMPPPLSDVRSKMSLARTGGVLQQLQNNRKKTIFHPTALLLLSPKLRSPSLHLLGSINILLLEIYLSNKVVPLIYIFLLQTLKCNVSLVLSTRLRAVLF